MTSWLSGVKLLPNMGIIEQLARLEELSYSRDSEQQQKLRVLLGEVKAQLEIVSLQDVPLMARSRIAER